jgi:hypothetical protein
MLQNGIFEVFPFFPTKDSFDCLPVPSHQPTHKAGDGLVCFRPSAQAHPVGAGIMEAVLSDIIRILGNPGLSDSHAKRLHWLFTSVAVNAVLEE